MDEQVLCDQAIKDSAVLDRLLNDLLPENKDKDKRFKSFNALMLVSESRPELLYERWDFLAGLLRSGNTNSKYNSLFLLANLAAVDERGIFESIFDDYFGLLADEKTSIAAHIAGSAGKIARAKPVLQSRITGKLLDLGGEEFDHKRQALIAGYAIESLAEYFEASQDKALIIEFARSWLQCESPKTRKIAKKFLEAHGS
ncbi:hypothetical protein [Methanocella arvoryzae]|uniref:HEAT repeat domain-containing protein n=1 Tax=Methanocella arvoryzae (strain DSM 22066 / NBRC 105507 / MRE50) TaxID=351160 RepID=Q0W2Q2_METAR|nr:hypothetical protein [Methanocella arvoryzae]CAJ37341.1 hypothetical protein RCIX2222 [Methanocella arvoryzae MRE50]